MNKTQITEKLDTLKEMIAKMNINTVEMINASAAIELKIRKAGVSETEMNSLENEINQIINQYNFLLMADRKGVQNEGN